MPRARKRNKKREKLLFKCAAFTFVLLILFYGIDLYFRPTVTQSLKYYATTKATELMSQAVSYAIEQTGYKYSDLAVITRNPEGNVTSIEANMLNITQIQSKITDCITENLKSLNRAPAGISLGTLCGSVLLAGKGPTVDIELEAGNDIKSNMRSSFSSAGINQTRHSIVLASEVNIGILMPGYAESVFVDNEFIVAETVIVGNVPDSYTEIAIEA